MNCGGGDGDNDDDDDDGAVDYGIDFYFGMS